MAKIILISGYSNCALYDLDDSLNIKNLLTKNLIFNITRIKNS